MKTFLFLDQHLILIPNLLLNLLQILFRLLPPKMLLSTGTDFTILLQSGCYQKKLDSFINCQQYLQSNSVIRRFCSLLLVIIVVNDHWNKRELSNNYILTIFLCTTIKVFFAIRLVTFLELILKKKFSLKKV